ncbi:hypothetical protein GS432_19450 [Rhodococcus hoagii]|nr:hypothetical protein [Prescottella equi]MBM4577736.1 hypothetical protein [Prescottella equi]
MSERTAIEVRNDGTDWNPNYVAEWDGQEVRASNPFGLDSKLQGIGAPSPRDLVLVDDGGKS